MMQHTTGTREEWLPARLEVLKEGKDLTKRNDDLALAWRLHCRATEDLCERAQRVIDRAHGSKEHSPDFLPFIADELGDQLPALGRVRFAGCKGAADAFSFRDIGYGGAGRKRLRDAREPAFAATLKI